MKSKSKIRKSFIHDKNVEVVVEVVKNGKRLNAFDQNGNKLTNMIHTGQRQKASNKKMALERRFYKDGRPYWRMVNKSVFMKLKRGGSVASIENIKKTKDVPFTVGRVDVVSSNTVAENAGVYAPFATQDEFIEYIRTSYDLKPKTVIIDELKWRHLIRTVMRGKNTMIVGMQGAGKTLVAKTISKVTKRPMFNFPLGQTQDPKGYLLGNSHFDKETGTVFYPSRFIKAIQTPGAVIVLEELTRSHPDVWNILMPVLDETQRFCILDETRENAVIQVSEGVTFISTANIGPEFTATRVLDRALIDRFTIIEIDVLKEDEEFDLLTLLYPTVDEDLLKKVAGIAWATRENYFSIASKLTTAVSTRVSVEMASMLFDGFALKEVVEMCVYPFFSNEGGLESERTLVKQMVQGFLDDGISAPFSPDDVNQAPI